MPGLVGLLGGAGFGKGEPQGGAQDSPKQEEMKDEVKVEEVKVSKYF